MTVAKAHHFVPQFLLRNFKSHTKNNIDYIYTITKDGARISTVRNTGYSNYFYGNNSELENLFAKKESHWANLINNNIFNNCNISFQKEIASFAWSLGIRSRSFRTEIENHFDKTFYQGASLVKEKPRAFDKDHFARNLIHQAKLTLKEINLPKDIQHKKMAELRKKIKNKKFIDEFREIYANKIYKIGTILCNEIPNGHNDALEELAINEFNAPTWVNKLNWKIHNSYNIKLILSDSIVLSYCDNTQKFGRITTFGDKTNFLIMPISSTFYITGRNSISSLDIDEINLNEKFIEISENEIYSSSDNLDIIQFARTNIGRIPTIEDNFYEKMIFGSFF